MSKKKPGEAEIKIIELDIVTLGMAEDLRRAFMVSCERTGNTPDDLEHFREWIFKMLAVICRKSGMGPKE